MDLVVHHVLEALVVGGAKEDLGVQFPASVTVEQDLQRAHGRQSNKEKTTIKIWSVPNKRFQRWAQSTVCLRKTPLSWTYLIPPEMIVVLIE